jgi:hypothetical protein
LKKAKDAPLDNALNKLKKRHEGRLGASVDEGRKESEGRGGRRSVGVGDEVCGGQTRSA